MKLVKRMVGVNMVGCIKHGSNYPCIRCLLSEIEKCSKENIERIKTKQPLHDVEGLKQFVRDRFGNNI